MHRLALRGANTQIAVLLICLLQIAGASIALLLESHELLVVVIGVGSVACASTAAWLASKCTNIGPVMGRPSTRRMK